MRQHLLTLDNPKEALMSSNTIYLYLKTHNVTGLKYLGKTIKDPFTYVGSGVYWKKHIKKHGNDVHTEILFECDDPKKFSKVAAELSAKFDIVESKEFANLCPEQGQGGDTSMCFTEQTFEALSRPRVKWNSDRKEEWSRNRSGNKNPMSEKTQSFLQKKKASELAKALHSKTYECEHCGKTTNLPNYKRWHGDNCKKLH